MSALRDRLGRLGAPPGGCASPPGPTPVPGPCGPLAVQLAALAVRRGHRLPGGPIATESGSIHVVDTTLPAGHHHGRGAVAEALATPANVLAVLGRDPRLAAADRRPLFLDLETTGLSRGAGTVPFLVGTAWFEGERLVVRQMFLRQLGGERAMLAHLAIRLAAADALVTYNGKSFDWPLVRDRYVLARLPVPQPPPHLDLLHAARRLVPALRAGARLAQAEQALLGLARRNDLGGAAVAARYLRYLRSPGATDMEPVFAHNAHDLAALPALVGALARRLAAGAAAMLGPADGLAVARAWARAGDWQRAEATLASLLATPAGRRDPAGWAELHLFAAEIAARQGRFVEQARALGALVRTLGAGASAIAGRAHLALAKVYEHRLVDLAAALDHAHHTREAEGTTAHLARLARLAKKLARAAGERAGNNGRQRSC